MVSARGKLSLGMFALASVLAACDTRTTSVVVADPGRVTIASNGTTVLPAADASAADQRGLVREDSFEPEPGARAHYKLEAVRENKELALEWSSRIPILNGEHQTIIDAQGRFNDPTSVLGIMTPETLNAPDLRLTACAQLDAVSAKGVSLVGYRATEWNVCGVYSLYQSSKLAVPFTLETPWSNVVEIRDHTEVNVGGDIGIGIFGLGETGGGVALMAVPKNCVGCVIGGAVIGLIGALTTLTAALDIAEGSRDYITYPAKKSAPH